MAGLAVTCEFNSLLSLQVFYVFLIERFAKRIAVRRLSPLRVRIRVAIAATFCGNKHFTGNESSGGRGCVAGREGISPELEIISSGNFLSVAAGVGRRRAGWAG